MIENNNLLTTSEAKGNMLSKTMSNIYLFMAAGLALTGVVSFAVLNNEPLLRTILTNQFLFFGLIIAELAVVVILSTSIHKMTPMGATIAFAAYSVLNGITLSPIFLIYTGESIATTFFVTAGTFAGVSLFGYVTKKDLTGVGAIAGMALWGLILASIVNLFLRSSTLMLITSYVGVVIFVALTAYDTQALKRMAEEMDMSDESTFVKFSIIGALKLYLDFINLFLMLLRIMGRRR
ncbi:Bax inhibitor-1/YccA family protein [Spirochaetia bacterium 38H-sp]|uniref:Bax inhibitor-1/YccA family protein n=1 Tax=Rarispira pelagica TaxID=3141764 RepID=A0ABU9U9Q7_9SPIR